MPEQCDRDPVDAGVIFDMDGVLIDSGPAHFESWQRVGEELGEQVSAEAFQATFGRPSRDIIRILFGGSLSDAEVRRIDDRKEALYRDIIRAKVPVMPGALELLGALDQAGLRLAIGSSAPPENIEQVTMSLGIATLFDAVVTGLDVKKGKPDPEVFLIAASRLSLPPRSCVVVEDAPPGLDAARRGGMRCIALTSSHPREALEGADLVVERLDQIDPSAVRRLLGLEDRRPE